MRFEVLGPLRVRRSGTELDLGFPQQRALLALLVVRAGRPVPAGEIVDVLWPERAPASARNVVRRYAGSLRRLLEPGLPPRAPGRRLLRGAGGYVLEAAEGEVDLLRFRALTKRGKRAAATGRSEVASRHFVDALGEWRGPVGMGVPAAVREHAVFAEVERELAATARMAADAALLSGGSEQVLPRLRQALERDPLDESLQAALVMALAASGLQAEALAAYDRVRRLLAEELGVAPGAELVAAHGRVLRQEWGPTRSRATTGPDRATHRPPAYPGASGPSPRPPAADPSAATTATTATTATAAMTATTAADRLPLASPVFVGRRAELARLAEITDTAAPATGTAPGTPASVLISGMPGIGKTALALHWADQVAGRFPDGRLDVGLRGFGPEGAPLDPAAALRALLTALGVPAARMPDRTDSLAGLYRSLLAGRRLLLVLDDAADTEQVRPLLPASPGCLTLVTSRHGLAGLIASGTHPLRLDLPPAADARAMLAAHTGPARPAAEPGAADEIVTRCGRLPLALTLAAARAAARPDIPLTALADELRRTRASLDAFAAPSRGSAAPTDPAGHGREPGTDPGAPPDLRTVFARSYRRLPPESARLFRLLARHPGPGLTPDAAAALAGLPARRARLLLDGLADAHLVTERAPGRYAQHELLRVFAAELAAAHGHGAGPETP
ncbi:BTAD domain-containing putative transcriptional regulator [Streptomyces scabiei]|uniref:AfsR/SARP family transcriptional regulator n=3 Tax=Streptomyces scabiei TaxID=1930 RepID=UPI001B30FF11|nr:MULTISPECIES: BTAD domain-containing putative transcriptional regulator [Streptomyces]MBP5860423.1 AfsR family transcriptional regulator [Streptomyces sp. LBUM 1484]MBP5879211.1 AfsR family transcriptional regulator [Streptomyces sp. LBUM 1477]MBP5887034.1 AfsR family transcriptional regulator [Streptomyces sp. LBUM 1487]MBP5890376.1 AfsR family transcriptional regulator [Streptomyces sp. LBUM 1481]MBP5903034.1 AfsR family transcriptional regulator [Streptomyces sp. LBUM 1488]